jgi:hypothetical protein
MNTRIMNTRICTRIWPITLSVLVLVWLGPGTSLGQAQPAASPPATAEPAASPPAASPAAPAPDEALRAAYDRAFAALLAGHFDAAIAGFGQVAASSPDPEQRAAARELRRLAAALSAQRVRFVVELGPTAPGPAAPTAPAVAIAEDPAAGRTSFVISTTLASVYGGVVLLDLLDVEDDARPSAGVLLATTGAGFLGSYYGSRGLAISEAMADAYSLGLMLGAGNGLLLAFAADLDDSSESVQMLTFGAMVAGGAGGLWLAREARPTRGQVMVTNITATLGFATAGLGLLVLQPDFDSGDGILWTLAGGLDAGTAIGMAMAPQVEWSLARARLTGLGAFLGGLTAWGGAVLITGTDIESTRRGRIWSGSALAGLWGGFGLSAYLTRRMEPDPRYLDRAATSALLTPTAVPGGLGLALSGAF